MSLCRRLLHRIGVPIRVAYPLSTPRLSSARKNSQNYRYGSAATLSVSTVSYAVDESRLSSFGLLDLPVERLVQALASFRIPETPKIIQENVRGKAEEGEMEEEMPGRIGKEDVLEPLDLYQALRGRDRSTLATLPLRVFVDLVKRAFSMKSPSMVEHLAQDTLEMLSGRDTDRRRLAREIIKHSAIFPLNHDTLIALLCLLEPPDSNAVLGRKLFECLARSILTSQDISDDTISALTPRFIARLHENSVPLGSGAITHNPPNIVELSFLLTQKLAGKCLHQTTLKLFRALVTTRHIPPEAMQEAHSGPSNFNAIILATLIRSALHWNWRRLAVSLLEDILKMSPSDISITSVNALVEDVIRSLLDTPLRRDIADCCSLICQLDHTNDVIVPDGLIELFYKVAEKMKLGRYAETVYSHTQSPSVLAKTQYAPPEGRALIWLMRYLTGTSRNMHLGRRLAKQVVALGTPIPYHDRGPFIAITAMHGYATEARALWERHTVSKSRKLVVGNAATMIRMTSLFVNVISRVRLKLETSNVVDAKEGPGQIVRAERHCDGSEVELSGTKRDITVDPTVEAERPLTREHFQERLKDLTSFVEHIVHEFRRAKEPLDRATHSDLSSLARAYFILGDVSAGFEAFRFLLDRREIPDLHDVNVALGAMASYDPQGSANMIERMIEKGLKPDAITFGTILHHAILHGDMELVGSLVRRSRDFEYLTPQSTTSLIRASVNPYDKKTKTKLRSNLERALDIVRSSEDSSCVFSPNTGKYCVLASLKLGDPIMAFRFWSILLKDKTEWEDGEQVSQRRFISKLIRKHLRQGWMRQDRAMMMLSQLGAEENKYLE